MFYFSKIINENKKKSSQVSGKQQKDEISLNMENTIRRTSMSPLTKHYPGPNEDEEICSRGPTVMKGICTTILYLMVNETVYTSEFEACVV